jgi:hypothetical protein
MQQRQVACAFDRFGEGALVAGACAGLAARADFPLFRNVSAQHLNLLVIDDHVVVSAELADARLRIEAPPAALFLSFIRSVCVFHFLSPEPSCLK